MDIEKRLSGAMRAMAEARDELDVAVFSIIHGDDLQASRRLKVAGNALAEAAKYAKGTRK
jgi:hypothetical protein